MLVVDAVSRSFGAIEAVRDVSFRARQGGVFGLLGPNGAGKTTTMRMILGIFAPDRGRISWNGEPIDLAVRRGFGYLPEERGLYAKMKVRDQIAYFGRLHGLRARDAAARTERWIERLELGPYAARACGELSKGNQQKVQLASAVLHDPAVLVLDEPFSGLDPVNAEIMLAIARDLAANGTTLVLSSHQLASVERICSNVCIVGAGRVRAAGTIAEMRAAYPTRSLRIAPDTPAIRAVFAARGWHAPPATAIAQEGLIYDVPATTPLADLLREACAAGPVDTFERGEPTLEAMYRRALEGDRPG